MKKNWPIILSAGLGAVAFTLSFASCVSIPKNATAVRNFDQQKYLGKWFEVARLDFKYEKHMSHVTAVYSMNSDGSIRVENRGYHELKQEWKTSTGKAKVVKEPTEARLKVSFFGPFYSGYNVIAIDQDYKYALVAGNNLKYLWLLSRQETMPDQVKNNYLKRARDLGYQIDDLVWTVQGKR